MYMYVCICDKELKTCHSLIFYHLITLIPILYLHKHISSQIIKVNKYQLSDACYTVDFPYTAWYYNMKQL